MAFQTAPVYLAEITVYDPTIATTKVLRYASVAFTTKPSETPASTFYDERISQPVDVRRTMFAGASTMGRSSEGLGELVLQNSDGLLDDLNDYGYDGQSITIRRTTVLNPSYPSDFTTIHVGTMAGHPTFSETDIRIQLRDRQQLVVDCSYQTTKYLGTNVLPAGLEGTSELTGKPKPVCYGTVKNVPAVCVNTSKLIYQVNDGAINSVDAVYDRGTPLTVALTSWTSRTSTFGSSIIWGLTWGNGTFVAVGDDAKVATSPDGSTWTSRTSGFGLAGNKLGCVAWIDALSLFIAGGVAAGGNGGLILTSPDGVTWTQRTTAFSTGATSQVLGLAYGNGVVVAVGSLNQIASSPDGINWTIRTSPFASGQIDSVAFGNGFFVIGKGGGEIASSPDGTTWTARTSGLSGQLKASIFGQNAHVVAGGSSDFTASIDGVTWAARTIPELSGSQINGMAYAVGEFLAAANSGLLATSPDSVTWFRQTTGTSSHLYCIAGNNSVVVAAGDSGTLISSGGASTYASQADLLDDTKAPLPGTFKYYAAGGYFRLGSNPDGLITADVTQGANAAARTAAQIWKLMLLRNPTLSGSDVSASDITTLDTANSAVCGDWQGTDETTVGAKADLPAQTVGAGWWTDASGVFRIAQLLAPSGTAVLTATQNDLAQPLARITPNDTGNGIPNYQVTIRYARYYATLTTDLAGGVSDASRALFAQEWRDTTTSDSGTLTAHPLSQPIVIESLFANSADAVTEAARVLALRIVKRDMYDVVMQLNSETAAVDINNIINLFSPRFGLAIIGDDILTYAGVFRVLDVAPDGANQQVRFTVWGRATGYVNLIADDGSFLVTDDGTYLLAAS